MSTITDGATTLTPRLVLGHAVKSEARNVVHPILGRPDPDITLRVASLRTGTLAILCDTVTDAYAMLALHSAATVLTLTDTDVPEVSMTYVVVGTASLNLDEETRVMTIVAADFQEVAL